LGKVGQSANFNVKNSFRFLDYFIFQRLIKKLIVPLLIFLKLIPRSEISFINKKKEISFSKKNILKKFLYERELLYSKKYVLVNSRSYDYFSANKHKISDEYIVHLDAEMNGRHELETRGVLPKKNVTSHYYHLRNFLNKLSKSYRKKL
jgi:hypothetical protein